jgi:hypothetical protein
MLRSRGDARARALRRRPHWLHDGPGRVGDADEERDIARESQGTADLALLALVAIHVHGLQSQDTQFDGRAEKHGRLEILVVQLGIGKQDVEEWGVF